MVIVVLTYKKSIEEIESSLIEHSAFLDKYYEKKKIVFSGRRNPRIGGVIVINTTSKEEAETIIKEDPFYVRQLADYDFIEVLPTKYDARFSCFLDE